MPWERLNSIKIILARRRNLRNSIFSVSQSIVSVACVFLSYKTLISYEGLDALGLWSLLLASGGIIRFLDVSGASSLSRFVARAENNQDGGSEVEVIHTLLLASFLINVVILSITLLISLNIVLPFLELQQRANAEMLLPWVMMTFLVMPLSSGISAAIDGLQRSDIRALVVSTAAIVSLCLTVVLVPQLGVIGFALGQVAQMFLVIMLGWLVLRYQIPDFGFFPHRWRVEIFRSTLLYSVKINGISLIAIFFEPLCKVLIGFTGGTVALGIYELASKLIFHIRSLAVAAMSPLVPLLAGMSTENSSEFRDLLLRSFRLTVLLSPCAALVSVLSAPIMSYLILGYFNRDMLQMNAILSWGWAVNLAVVPIYLAAQAMGFLRWNFLAHLALSISVILCWLILRVSLGQMAVVIGISVGLLIGALVVIIGNRALLVQSPKFSSLRWQLAFSMIVTTMFCLSAIYVANAAAALDHNPIAQN